MSAEQPPHTAISGSPKSEGSPTRNEKIGNRADDGQVTFGNHTSSSNPSHKAEFVSHANTDPLQRKDQTLTSQSSPNIITSDLDPNSPQFCLKFTPVSESPLPEVDHDHTSSVMSGGWNVKSRRPNPSDANHLSPRDDALLSPSKNEHHPRSKSIALRRVEGASGRGEDDTDFDLSSYIARMRTMGHKRSSSAPIKHVSRVSRQNSNSSVSAAEGGGVVGVASKRSRHMVWHNYYCSKNDL